jgi:hypothetical protein
MVQAFEKQSLAALAAGDVQFPGIRSGEES